MAIKLGEDGQLQTSGAKKEYSRTANELCDEAYPKLQKNKDGTPPGLKYFRSLLGSLTGMLDKLGSSTNSGVNIKEIAFVDIYKKIFIYLDNQDEQLFSLLTEQDCEDFFNATSRVATFQNAASELKEMTPEQMDDLKLIQEESNRLNQLMGSDVLELDLPDIDLSI